jgi:hypothetical protein
MSDMLNTIIGVAVFRRNLVVARGELCPGQTPDRRYNRLPKRWTIETRVSNRQAKISAARES